MSFHAVCSVEVGTQTIWTAELLWYSWQRAGQPEPLTFTCAGGVPPELVAAGADVLPHDSHSHEGGDFYPPYNQPYGLQAFLESGQAQLDAVLGVDSILVLEPDMVLLDRLPAMEAIPGRPLGHGPWLWHGNEYMGMTSAETRAFSVHPELVESVGVPFLMARSDLAALLPGWIERTAQARALQLPVVDRWCASMWGLSVASADLGLRWQLTDWGERPLLHYMGATPGAMYLLPWTWNKHAHHPWDDLPPIPPDAPDAAREFAALYDDYRHGIAP